MYIKKHYIYKHFDISHKLFLYISIYKIYLAQIQNNNINIISIKIITLMVANLNYTVYNKIKYSMNIETNIETNIERA